MQVCRTIAETRTAVAAARSQGQRIGFVPTMGALHAAHASLMDAARDDGMHVVVSIFVNPTQFAPNEDFDRYPRDEAGDLALCERAGVDTVFAPSVEEMYPQPGAATIHVEGLTETLCGPFRPGHFDAVATVVAKLLNIAQPDRAYFGEKDYQQLAVVRRMVSDLNLPVEIVGCPTLREPDGLAMSSRNRYLTPEQREQAASLSRGLNRGAGAIRAGERDARRVVAEVRAEIEQAGPAEIQYISLVDPGTLAPVATIDRAVVLALAVYIGRTRLIDNVRVDPSPGRQ